VCVVRNAMMRNCVRVQQRMIMGSWCRRTDDGVTCGSCRILENDTDSRTYGDLRSSLRCHFERETNTRRHPNINLCHSQRSEKKIEDGCLGCGFPAFPLAHCQLSVRTILRRSYATSKKEFGSDAILAHRYLLTIQDLCKLSSTCLRRAGESVSQAAVHELC
jgi:hypothetical protein